jgi:hypothetical protein
MLENICIYIYIYIYIYKHFHLMFILRLRVSDWRKFQISVYRGVKTEIRAFSMAHTASSFRTQLYYRNNLVLLKL